MSGCKFPEHHKSSDSGGLAVVPVLVAIGAVALAVKALAVVAAFVMVNLAWIIGVPGTVGAVVIGYLVARSAPLSLAACRNWPRAIWARLRWRHLAGAVKLAYLDSHRRRLWRPRLPRSTSVRVADERPPARQRVPRAVFRPNPYGFTVRCRTIPGVGREQLEVAAPHLANYWRAGRVGVHQPKPGRLELRAMVRDPLTEPLGSDVLPRFDGRRILLGRDEYGQLRYASLAGLSSSVIGGNPGRGKSVCGTSIAVQLAPVPNSDWYVLDGGGGADWSMWAGRAVAIATDDLAAARDVIEDAHARMVKRLATLTADLGTKNAWTVGPSEDYRLVWVPVDESSVYLDLESAKALGKDAEQNVRAIRALVKNMQQRGRKVLYHVSLLAQKCTSNSIPPDLRDLAGLRLSFGVATTEQAISVLGDEVRTYPSLSPVQLQEDEHVGVAVARLKTGADPYTRLRIPFVDEDQAAAVASDTARPAGPAEAPRLRVVA
jgi:DNA segregation ATPase FtsK/SpoIIIE, S-DNA-T family